MARFRQRRVAPRLVAPGGPAHNAVRAVCLAGEREAKRLVPRDTSVLANSIGSDVQVTGLQVRGQIGTNVSYAAPVEFGTHAAGEPDAPGKRSYAPGGMGPRPYLRPGLLVGIAYARARRLIR